MLFLVFESAPIPSPADNDVRIYRSTIIHADVVAETAIVAYIRIYAAGFRGLVCVITEIILKRGIRIVRSSANSIIDMRFERQKKNLSTFRQIIVVVALVASL
jgi:divalent metal cation (Fe/Co/Zn/Cd) transporter